MQWGWRRRILPVLLWLVAALVAFDRVIYVTTEVQWFASLGFESLFWSRFWAQAQLFGAFLGVAVLLAALFLRPVTRLAPGASASLRGRLADFEPLRQRASRLAWGIVWVSAIVLAHGFSGCWNAWLMGRGADTSASFLGLPRELWTHFLPLFEPFLRALWSFSLLLWLVVAATGTLRALPLLAARAPTPPPALPRTLWRLGALILGLRALIYVIKCLDLARGRALETGDLVVSAPIFVAGAIACAALMIGAFRRATRPTPPQKTPRLGFGIAAALALPSLLNWLSFPLRALLPDTPKIAALRQSATRDAWQLASSAPPSAVSTPIEAAWPVWDETALLEARRGASFRNNRLVEWQSATLGFEKGRWRALVAGQSATAMTWTTRRDADNTTALAFERLEWSAPDGALKSSLLSGAPSFFGFEGRSLFGNGEVGVPINSIWAKWAWAWRLRDFLLPLDGANATRLLVWRGARERAEKLAPGWKIGGEPRLVMQGENPVWLVPLCAASADFPGSMRAESGELAGQNAAGEGAVMRLDARTGAVSFLALDGAQNSALLPMTREIPAALRSQIVASSELLRAQLALEIALPSDDSGFQAVLGPQRSYEVGRGPLSRVVAVRGREWLSLEASDAAPTERVFRRTQEDFAGKMASIDAQLGQNPPSQSQQMRLGEPFCWPDASAPGGWWLARASFAAPRDDAPLQGMAGHSTRLWRVALTGALPGSRVEIAASAREARLRFLPAGARAAQAPIVAPTEKPAAQPTPIPANSSSLEAQALEIHRAEQAAAKRGDWTAFGRQSARLDAILGRISAQRRKVTPQNNVPAAP